VTREEIQKWVHEVHSGTIPAIPTAARADASTTSAEVDSGLWWAVLNVESADFEPESMWPNRDDAQQRADGINAGRHPSYHVLPAIVAWWMRNEYMPDTETT
jgi:hypothetical protein